MSEGGVGAQPATPAILHRLLIIMTIGFAAIVAILAALGLVPLIAGDESQSVVVVAYIFAAIQTVMLVVTVAVLVPKVPRRRQGQSAEVYWADTDSGPRLLMVWFLCEGAATLGLVGFLLFGNPAPAIASAIAIAALVAYGPRRFMGSPFASR